VRVMPFVFPGVVRIPARNSFEEGAMLEPVNTVLKAVERLALLAGDCALVIGQGPIGLMFTQLLALRGIKVAAADLVELKLKAARRFGARWTLLGDVSQQASPLTDLTRGRGFDAVVVAVPADPLVPTAQKLARGAGKILLFAHTRRGAESPIDLAAVC